MYVWLRYVSEGADRCNSQTFCWSASNLSNDKQYNDTFFHNLKFLGKILQEGPQHSSSGNVPLHVYLTSCKGLFLPGLPPPFLHTASDQKLEAGSAWEWGYECGASTVAGLIPRHV